jgi:signal transduction histidine kinase
MRGLITGAESAHATARAQAKIAAGVRQVAAMGIGSLKARVSLWVAVVVVLALTAHAAYLVGTAHGRLRARLEANARLFAGLATEPLCRALDTFGNSGFFRFRQVATEILERTPDVVAFEIRDVQGDLLFHSRALSAPEPETAPPEAPDPGLLAALREVRPAEAQVEHEGEQRLRIVVPHMEDFGRHRMAVVYYVSYASLPAELRRYAAGTVAITLASIAAAIGLGLALARSVTRPLAALTEGVERLAGGDFAHRVEVVSGDELQRVGEAFNAMAGRLASTVAELRHSNAELERRNAELERFTYTVSHDLRSPLVTVQGFLGAVEQAALRGDTRRVSEDAARIRSAANRMERLLRELLDLSRIGRVVGAPEPVAFSDVALEAVALAAGRLAERGVEVEIDPTLPVVTCDRLRLVEVVQNLVDNAAKFMGAESRPRIRISWRRDGEEPVFTVADNGIGIEPRHHETVFGLFDRLDPGVEGTGIGLALVRRIVEVHGGRVWVESEGRDRGSTFCFTLGQPAGSPTPPDSAKPSP